MALLKVALPDTSFAFSHSLSSSNQGNNLLTKQLKLPSLHKRTSSLAATCSSQDLHRTDFPPSFKFGAASSAIQTESYANEGGRGSSSWDEMLGDKPAVLSLLKFQEDIACLKNIIADVYRFSISWPRILPNGKYSGPKSINQEGVDFYNKLLDELHANGIMPVVTLFHFDIPSALQKEYNGMLGSQFVSDFNAYSDLCFQLFGSKVKHWATFNEPSTYCENGYQYEMTGKDQPAVYPYLAAHHLLLAHATAVKTYRDNYQKKQDGKIGISLVTTWLLPYSDSPNDIASSQRLWDFIVGWYLDPLVTGDYPFSMKTVVRDRLPQFSSEEQEMLKGSYDFIGINYYTSRYTRALPFSSNDLPVSYSKDQYAEMLTENSAGVSIGPKRVLEHCDDLNTQQIIMDEIMQSVCTLAQDQYGNYVIQHVLQHGKPQERSAIISKLAGQIVKMSQQKFASNVVEKCLTFGGPEERQLLVNEMLGSTDENESLQAMMKDPFGNYVVQKVLKTCDDQSLELIVSRIKVHLNALKRYTYGKHIVSRVEKLIATGERRIGLSSSSFA